jgi:hypothetical protein
MQSFQQSISRASTLLVALVALIGLISPSLTFADGPKLLNTHVVGSVPNIMIRSVVSGGAPWVVKNGKVQLDSDGHLLVRVKGLVITEGALANGNPVPPALVGTVATVTTVHAALTCGGPGGGVPFTITSTEAVPLSPEGDFVIDTQVSLPAVCAQPILLIRIGDPTSTGPWIAASELSFKD